MKYHKQLFPVHDPDNGIYGDCYRTVIACLLDLDPEEVPHVCDNMPDDYVGKEHEERMNAFLGERGLRHVEMPLLPDMSLQEVLDFCAVYFGDSRYTLMGKSSGGYRNHIVICKGTEIEHSTNDSTVERYAINSEYWWIGFLMKVA